MKTTIRWNGAFRWGSCNWVLSLGICWLLVFSWKAQALIRVGTNELTHDPGWPAGTREYVALTSRVQWFEGPPLGGGQWTFQSRGDTAALQKAVEAFAKIVAPVREIHLKAGPATNMFQGGAGPGATFDWDMSVWVHANWERLFGANAPSFMKEHPDFGATQPPLRLIVYVHDKGPDWTRLQVPTGVRVVDERTKPAEGKP